MKRVRGREREEEKARTKKKRWGDERTSEPKKIAVGPRNTQKQNTNTELNGIDNTHMSTRNDNNLWKRNKFSNCQNSHAMIYAQLLIIADFVARFLLWFSMHKMAQPTAHKNTNENAHTHTHKLKHLQRSVLNHTITQLAIRGLCDDLIQNIWSNTTAESKLCSIRER